MVKDRPERRGRGGGRVRAKGLAKARRAPLFVERTHRALSREAEEILFEHAEVLTEGSAERDEALEREDPRRGRGGSVSFFGSTMITIDLDRVGDRLRGLDAPGAREALRDVVASSVRVRLRAMRIACAEVARRVPEREFGTAQVEITASLVGSRLHLDVDVEVPLDRSSERASK